METCTDCYLKSFNLLGYVVLCPKHAATDALLDACKAIMIEQGAQHNLEEETYELLETALKESGWLVKLYYPTY